MKKISILTGFILLSILSIAQEKILGWNLKDSTLYSIEYQTITKEVPFEVPNSFEDFTLDPINVSPVTVTYRKRTILDSFSVKNLQENAGMYYFVQAMNSPKKYICVNLDERIYIDKFFTQRIEKYSSLFIKFIPEQKEFVFLTSNKTESYIPWIRLILYILAMFICIHILQEKIFIFYVKYDKGMGITGLILLYGMGIPLCDAVFGTMIMGLEGAKSYEIIPTYQTLTLWIGFICFMLSIFIYNIKRLKQNKPISVLN